MATNKDTLNLAYSAKCKGIIWKIILDESKNIAVWECRTKDKTVSFYAYDFNNEQVLLNDFRLDESWQLSIHTVVDGILYLNGYESEFSPVQKGLIAYDLYAQKILWQNFSIGTQLFAKEGIVVFDSKILPRKYQLVNYLIGTKVKDVEIADLSQMKPLKNDIVLPEIIEAENMLDTTYKLIYNSLTITSFYQMEKNVINQYIKVEENHKILYSEIINNDIQKISFDTFFVWHNRLFYIRNKSEIVSYFV